MIRHLVLTCKIKLDVQLFLTERYLADAMDRLNERYTQRRARQVRTFDSWG